MPTPTYIALATVTLGVTSTNVTFSSIPGNYRDLVLVMTGASTLATDVSLLINNDSSNIYSSVRMLGDGVNTASSTNSGTTGTWLRFSGSPTIGTNIVEFFDYAQTNKHKTLLIRTDNSNSLTASRAARYASTNSITSFKVTSDTGLFSIGSTFSLYGVAA